MPSRIPTKFTSGIIIGATLGAIGTATLKSGYVGLDEGSREVRGTASGVSLTAGGGTFQATNLADAACRKSTNGRYYDCYQEAVFTNTGGCVAGGCSTRSYNVASITKPFSGTGVIKRTDVTCGDDQGVATAITVGTVSATTSSGSNVLFRKNIGSGATISTITGNTASALMAYSGAIVWTELNNKLKVSASAKVGAHQQCIIGVWSDQVYNP